MMMAVAVVVKKKVCSRKWWIGVVRQLLLLLLLPTTLVSSSSSSNSNHHGNPANDLVDIINKNRTAQKLPQLNDSPGLGCMALQYVELCKDNCTGDGAVNCKPPENDFTEVFPPNCGVELPTFGMITAHILGCQAKYVEPSLAFSDVLVKDGQSLSIMRNKSHLEVGVGLVEVHKGPFFWCSLFSDAQTNSTFVLQDNGKGIQQRRKGASVEAISHVVVAADRGAVCCLQLLYTSACYTYTSSSKSDLVFSLLYVMLPIVSLSVYYRVGLQQRTGCLKRTRNIHI